MPNGDFKCTEHSGCIARIKTLEEQTHSQWDKLDSIFTRLNVILGSVVIACIMLVINILIK